MKKIMIMLGVFLGIACGAGTMPDSCSCSIADFQLSENFEQLKLSYQTEYVPGVQALSGNVTVDASGLAVHFFMKKAAGTPQEMVCNDDFAITATQLDELRNLVSQIEYVVLNPTQPVYFSEIDHLMLKLDEEKYEIRDPHLMAQGKFIAPANDKACQLRFRLKEWVDASGLSDNCPGEVVDRLFPDACQNL
jgi:hypothetical protein